MQFLRTLFWIVIVVVVMLFAFNNWTKVEVRLWDGLLLETKLPLLLFIAFLLGLVPMAIVHRASRWRMARRLETSERALAEARGLAPAPAPAALDPGDGTPPPAAVPTAVPPGVS